MQKRWVPIQHAIHNTSTTSLIEHEDQPYRLCLLQIGEPAKISGKQELYENIFAEYAYKVYK